MELFARLFGGLLLFVTALIALSSTPIRQIIELLEAA